MAVYFSVCYVFESISRYLMLMDEVHGIGAVNSAFHSLGESSNFIAVTVPPNLFVFWAFHKVAVFNHVAISIHHGTR